MTEPRTPASVTPAVRRTRDPAIETLRGLAIVLVVIGHVIGIDETRSMQVAPDSGWRILYLAFVDVRLPLFTVISGYIYAIRPVSVPAGLPTLARTKARRLLLPMATVGTILFVMQMVIPGTNYKPAITDYYRVFVYGYEHLWFLQAVFLIFLIVAALDVLRVLSTLRGALVALAVSLVLLEVVPVSRGADLFSISGVLRLLPYFLLGYILKRYPPTSASFVRCALIAAPILAAAYAVRFNSIVAEHALNPYLDRFVSACIGIATILLLFAVRRWLHFRPLVWIGGFAFGIYLLHPFGTAASRILLEQAGVTAHAVQFAVGLAVGLAWPIVFEQLTKRSRVIRTAILGEKWSPEPKRQTGSASSAPGS